MFIVIFMRTFFESYRKIITFRELQVNIICYVFLFIAVIQGDINNTNKLKIAMI